MDFINIGMAGLGTVGGGVVKNLRQNGSLLRERTGASFRISRAVVRDPGKDRGLDLSGVEIGTDWRTLVEDPQIQIVIELMGGIAEAKALCLGAISAGKMVITGNKALLAEHGQELFHLSREKGVPIFYEAAVAGGIPIIKAVRESFVGNRIENLHGILNGTSNYILTRMAETGMDFAPALAEAQQLGYAEADPALDINGWDAAHKAIILASLAYGKWIAPTSIYVDGIESVTSADIRFARALGYSLKLLATIRTDEKNRIEVRVCPTLIPETHVLASVQGVFNAIWLRGDVVGDALFYGRGAGQDPTASSVIGDLADAAAVLRHGDPGPGFVAHDLYGDCLPVEESVSAYYLRLAVEDRPGVLAQVAGLLGEANIGISSVIQPEGDGGEEETLPLILMIHDAPFGAMRQAVESIAQLSCVRRAPRLFHVETMRSRA
jgi:homoserine dehydrogenase